MEVMARNGTLARQVEEEIRHRIVFGQIRLGSRISEQNLASSLGVSKTPVRNALLKLQEEGLVEIKPQKGTFVCKPDATLFQDVSLLRTLLEPVALASAYQQSRDAFLRDLNAAYVEMEESIDSTDYHEYIRQDMRFHDLFFEHCANPFIRKAYWQIRPLLAILRVQLTLDIKHLRKSYVEHRSMISHLENGDCDFALQTLDNHISFNKKSYWSDISHIVEMMYPAPVSPK